MGVLDIANIIAFIEMFYATGLRKNANRRSSLPQLNVSDPLRLLRSVIIRKLVFEVALVQVLIPPRLVRQISGGTNLADTYNQFGA